MSEEEHDIESERDELRAKLAAWGDLAERFDKAVRAGNDMRADVEAARRERDEAIRAREEQDTAAQRRAEQYCRAKREAERERDALRAENADLHQRHVTQAQMYASRHDAQRAEIEALKAENEGLHDTLREIYQHVCNVDDALDLISRMRKAYDAILCKHGRLPEKG